MAAFVFLVLGCGCVGPYYDNSASTSTYNEVSQALAVCDAGAESVEVMTCYEAVAELHKEPSVCGKIESPDYRDRCYKTIAETVNDSRLCEIIQDEYYKNECYLAFGATLNKTSE